MTADELMGRLHRVLVDEIRTRRPEYLRSPFTVAEIYQDLVPYGSHRDRIGASMNGDYEHALLRLLAGEGDLLRIESEPARKQMEDELGSSNPNTGLFREFAALDVRLNPERIPAETGGTPAEPTPPSPSLADDLAPLAPPAAPPSPPETAAPTLRVEKGSETADRGTRSSQTGEGAVESRSSKSEGMGESPSQAVGLEAPRNCRWCREELPRRESLRYCPFCGIDVTLIPCVSCGEEVEPGWRFCIACGAEVAAE